MGTLALVEYQSAEEREYEHNLHHHHHHTHTAGVDLENAIEVAIER